MAALIVSPSTANTFLLSRSQVPAIPRPIPTSWTNIRANTSIPRMADKGE